MKNNIVDEMEKVEKSQDTMNTIISISMYIIIVSILLGVFYFALKYASITDKNISTNNSIITTAVVTNIYKEKSNIDTKYYIIASTDSYGTYNIEVNRGAFVSYKINNSISIKIYPNHKAILIE